MKPNSHDTIDVLILLVIIMTGALEFCVKFLKENTSKEHWLTEFPN